METFKRGSRGVILSLCLAFVVGLFPASAAFADGEEVGQGECQVVSGQGSAADPFVYHIGSGAKVSWKHLEALADDGTVDRYERLFDDGTLDYAWVFTGGLIPSPAGPYWLEVSRYNLAAGTAGLPGGEGAYYFSTANKADFGGEATVVLNVSDAWEDGTGLALFYYGGISDAVVHGAGNPIDPQEYLQVDEVCAGADDLSVDNGCVEVPLSFGGNFFLVPSEEASSVQCTAAKPAIASRSLPGAPPYLGEAAAAAEGNSGSASLAAAPVNGDAQAPADGPHGLSAWQDVLLAVIALAAIGIAVSAFAIRRSRKAS